MPHQVIEAVAVVARRDEPLRLLAVGERPSRPPARRLALRGRNLRGSSFAGLRSLLEIVALPLVEFVAGPFERPAKGAPIRRWSEKFRLHSSSEVVIQTVAASGARVAARKTRISLLRSRFTRFVRGRTACAAGPASRSGPARSRPGGIVRARLAAEQVDQAAQADAGIAHHAREFLLIGRAQFEAQPERPVRRQPQRADRQVLQTPGLRLRAVRAVRESPLARRPES